MPLTTAIAGHAVPEPPAEYLTEIGRVVVRWNTLEGYLDLTLIKLLGKDIKEKRSHVVFTHMAVPQKFDVLAALVNEIIESGHTDSLRLDAAYKRTAPLLKKAQTLRNDVIHAKWGVDSDGSVRADKVSARGKLKMYQRTISTDEVIAASNAIYEAAEALYEMAWRGIPAALK